jgi:superfamily II DNA or RNA helicase
VAGSLRVGDIVGIRGERWRILGQVVHGDTTVVEAAGCDATNRTTRARFLVPFEPVDRFPASAVPRTVRPLRWRCIARRVLADATPSWTSLRAPAYAHLELIPFQLEPALALIRGDACRFLIADGVGLGKTVQAGLMIAETLARRPDGRALIVAPAALRRQWRDELRARFSLDAELLDAAATARLTAGLPPDVNPWAVPRIIVTSIDYVKRPEVMRSLEALTWDFVVFDEAHNLGGRSDRAAAAHAVGQRARVLALLTATPHSGDDDAFRRLCRIGDVNDAYPLLMFRRTRMDAGHTSARRTTLLRVRPTAVETAMHAALMAYATRVWNECGGRMAPGAKLAMTVLARRACSSAGSLARSVERRLALLQDASWDGEQTHLPFGDVSAEDAEPEALLGSPGLLDADDERSRLTELLELAWKASANESKLACLRRLLRRAAEPAIIFTEYRDTLKRIASTLDDMNAVQLHGGLTERERTDALSRFAAGTSRLLLATDAASEGLNLHHRCRLVINLELPWTPVRLDQRAGRVDRIGQSRTVHAIRLVAAQSSEETILARLANRIDRMRDALGVIPDEQAVAESVLGLKPVPTLRRAGSSSGLRLVRVSLRQEAAREAERLGLAARWLEAGVSQSSHAVVSRLRARGAPRRECVWAFRIAVASASGRILWQTVVATAASLADLPERSAAATREVLAGHPGLNGLTRDFHVRQVGAVHNSLRKPLALWIRREHDLMRVIHQDYARMSAVLLQPSLFDRRTQRAAASQAAIRDDALSNCRARLDEYHACQHAQVENCDLAFAVMLE